MNFEDFALAIGILCAIVGVAGGIALADQFWRSIDSRTKADDFELAWSIRKHAVNVVYIIAGLCIVESVPGSDAYNKLFCVLIAVWALIGWVIALFFWRWVRYQEFVVLRAIYRAEGHALRDFEIQDRIGRLNAYLALKFLVGRGDVLDHQDSTSSVAFNGLLPRVYRLSLAKTQWVKDTQLF